MAQENFRQQHKTKYEEFREGVDMAFSSPLSAFFGGEHSVIDGGMSVVQHLDRYVWAGVKDTQSTSPHVNPVVYVPTLADRENSVPDGYDLETENFSSKRLQRILSAACRRFGFSEGVDIRLLTEGFPGSGANTSGAIAAAVSACLFWSSKIMNEKEFDAISTVPPGDLARKQADPGFRRRMRDAHVDDAKKFTPEEKICFLVNLAWVIDAFSHEGRASGYGAVAGVVHSRLPFCFFPERRSPHPGSAFGPMGVLHDNDLTCRAFDLRQGVRDVNNIEEAFDPVVNTVAEISFCVFPLEDILREDAEIRKTGSLPFTWGVVHSGCAKNTGQKISNVEKLPHQRWQSFQSTMVVLEQAGADEMVDPSHTAFGFLRRFGKQEAVVLRDPMRWEMIGLQSELLLAACRAMEGQGIGSLAACMRRNHGILDALALDWYEGRLIADAIYRAVGKSGYEQTAVKLSGGGGGGCLVFIAPAGAGPAIAQCLGELQGLLPKMDVVMIRDDERPSFQFGTGLSINPRVPRYKRRQRRLLQIVPLGKPSCQEFEGMITRSATLGKVFHSIPSIAETDKTVLIRGESGTGKEKVAHALHRLSRRKDSPFITVNCASFTEGIADSELFGHVRGAFTGAFDTTDGHFRAANMGTLFLDEIAEVPFASQAKLLRAIEDKRIARVGESQGKFVDVRIIAATNRDLKSLVTKREFRSELLHRIDVLRIDLPPLRDRPCDIEILIQHILHRNNESGRVIVGYTPTVVDCLKRYRFDGNVRELDNILMRAVVQAGTKVDNTNIIEMEDLLLNVGVEATSSEGLLEMVSPGTTVMDAVNRAWAPDDMTMLLCMVFEYKNPGAHLSRGDIEELCKSESLLLYAQDQGFSRARTESVIKEFTPKRVFTRLCRLCEAGWIQKAGESRRAITYCRGPRWPSAN